MLKLLMMPMLCGCVLLVDAPVEDEAEPDVDCQNQITQFDMNVCSQRDYEAADVELNAQWKLTRKAMVDTDASLSDNLKGAEKALIAAQRAWIAYRDTQCELAGFDARGGSMEPMLVSGCMAEMTRARTEELKDIANGPGN